MWLVCPTGKFRILGRPNLEKQVAIKTPAQALEFVRLFSTADTWYLSTVDQMVEVTPTLSPEPCEFAVSRIVFLRFCVPPTALPTSSGPAAFVVKRSVVKREHRAFVIVEAVARDGTVTLSELTPINVDAHSLGGFCDPYIM